MEINYVGLLKTADANDQAAEDALKQDFHINTLDLFHIAQSHQSITECGL